jgi:filamentous hemagglutinin family protein
MRDPDRHSPRSRWLATSALALPAVISLLAAQPARSQALPSGGAVTAGSATISAGASGVTIQQGSNRAVIDWKSFSIGAGGAVTFNQPGAQAAILNRVTGGDISRIEGMLNANGQVFVINRNGLIVTPTGQVRAAGGFVASSLDIKNDDFMAGKLAFAGQGGAILNQGQILTGQGAAVALIGGQVANSGVITAPLGQVMLGSGQQATLDLSGNGYLQIALPANLTDDGSALVENTGRIDAQGGTVVMRAAAAAEAVRRVVNMSGVILATGVSGQDGAVVLDGGAGGTTTVSGTIDVSGPSHGGTVDITGGAVALTGAQVLATGGAIGGAVRVGGAFQGGAGVQTPEAPRFGVQTPLAAAQTTSFDAASLIDVSGGTAGGSAVLWSLQSTLQHGAIKALGGAVEISSRGVLNTGLAKVSVGGSGVLLLDPVNIGVGIGGSDTLVSTVNYTDNTGSSYNFNVLDLEAALEAGTNVVLRASNDISMGNLSVSVAVAHPGSLTLSAGRSVTFYTDIAMSNANLTVTANDSAADGVVSADRAAGAGEINILQHSLSATAGLTGGNISLIEGTGAGVANGQAADMRISDVSGDHVSIDMGTSGKKIRFFGLVALGFTSPNTVSGLSSVTINGAIEANGTAMTFDAPSVSWTDETSAALTGSTNTVFKFTQNGTVTRYGVIGGFADQTRLALGQGGASPQYTANFGAAYPTFNALHIVSGAMHGADTLSSILAGGSVNINGPAAGAGIGNQSVVVSATNSFGFSAGVKGYLVNLATVTDILRINGQLLTPTVIGGSYVYGSPIGVVNLAGLQPGDSVTLTATLGGGGFGTLSLLSGTTYAFPADMAAGNRAFTLVGLGGPGAGNYTLDLSGVTGAFLHIAPKPITFQSFSVTSTYGALTTPTFQFSGLLFSDAVTAGSISLTGSGGATTLSATTPAGSYAIGLGSLSGPQGGDYTVAGSGNILGTLTIAPKPLTYVSTSVTSTYGTLANVATPMLTGVVPGDSVTAVTQLSGGAGPQANTPAGIYSVTAGLTGAGASNYVISGTGDTIGTLTVNPKALTFQVASPGQVYGSPAAIVTLNGILAGDNVLPSVLENGAGVNLTAITPSTFGYSFGEVGAHNFTFAGLIGLQAGDYSVNLGSGATGTLTITPRPLTWSINSVTANYGVTTALPVVTLNNLVGGDGGVTASLIATRQSDSAVVTLDRTLTPVGTYTLTAGSLSGLRSNDYTLSTSGNPTGLFTVNPRALTYTIGNTSSTYGTSAILAGYALIGVVNADQVGATIGVKGANSLINLAANTAPGTYQEVLTGLTGANAGNYVLATSGNIPGLLTISPKVLTYSLSSGTTVYGTPYVPAFGLSGVLPGDQVTPLVGTGGGAVLAANTQAGTYTIVVAQLTGAQASNYTLATSGNTPGTLIVQPKALTYTVAAGASVYGDPIGPGAVTFGGAVAGDTPTGVVTVPGAQQGSNAGNYGQSLALSGISAIDYILTTNGSTLGGYTITPRPTSLSVSPNVVGNSAPYGFYKPSNIFALVQASNPAPADQFKGLSATVVNPGYGLSTGGYIDVGIYNFSGATLTGASASNYTVTGVTYTPLSITPRPLSTFGSFTLLSTYGSTNPSTTGFLPTVAAGDQVAISGLSVSNNGAAVPLSLTTPVGSYTLSAGGVSGADAGNYTFVPGPIGTLTINPKALTWSVANTTSVYGDPATAGAATLFGVVGSDQVSGVSGFTATVNGQSHAGTYASVVTALTGAGASNYTLSGTGDTPGVHTITPRPITFSYTPRSYVYGDIVISGVTLNGLVNGDVVTPLVEATLVSRQPGDTRFLGAGYTLTDAPVVLPAGGYNLQFAVGSTGRAQLVLNTDYSLANDGLPFGTVTVAARPVTYVLSATSGASVYGTPPTAILDLRGTLPGQPLAYTLTNSNNGAAPVDIGTAIPANLPAGADTISVRANGADAFDYALTSGNGVLTVRVSPKPITASYDTTSGTYGTKISDLVSIPGVLAGDDIGLMANFGAGAFRLATGPAGYDLDLTTLSPNVGFQAFNLSMAGPQAGNYTLASFSNTLTLSPKTVTYTAPSITWQYGGLTAPTCSNPGCELTGTDIGSVALPTAKLNGILAQDASSVQPVQILTGSTVYNGVYTRQTPAGSYLNTVTGLQGSGASNYVLAQSGNTLGAVTILPAWVAVTADDGGLIYNGSLTGSSRTVGDAFGVSKIRRGVGATGFVLNDNVQILVGLFNFDGTLYSNSSGLIPIGDYVLKPVGLGGTAAASNYRLVPVESGGSVAGTYLVQDASIFSFAFLSGSPNTAYTPPATVTPAAASGLTANLTTTDANTGLTLSGAAIGSGLTNGAQGSAGTTSVSDLIPGAVNSGPISGTARGTAAATTSATTGAGGPVSLTGTLTASATGMVQYSPLGQYAGASATSGASVTVGAGPVNVTEGAQAGASAAYGWSLISPEVETLDAQASISQSTTVSSQGNLGSGVSGGASLQQSVFVLARSNQDIGAESTGVSEFAGVGASVGTTGSLSGGGVTGSASVTVFSPGSLYLGLRTVTDYSDGTLTLGLTAGLSIGIGGLELKPSVSIDTKPVVSFLTDLGQTVVGINTSCGIECQQANAAAAKQAKLTQAENMLKNGSGATLDLMAYLAANPDVVDMAKAAQMTDPKANWVFQAQQAFGDVPGRLNSVISEEQTLAQRLATNPSSVSFADMQQAQLLRQQEAQLIGAVHQLGGSIQVSNGQITMVSGNTGG